MSILWNDALLTIFSSFLDGTNSIVKYRLYLQSAAALNPVCVSQRRHLQRIMHSLVASFMKIVHRSYGSSLSMKFRVERVIAGSVQGHH
jgi:hypothetical protein